MAEALISVLLERLESIIRQLDEEGIRLFWVAELYVKKLKGNFLAIQDVLADAEIIQLKDDAFRSWLDDVRNIAYNVDDVLDEWNKKIQKLQMKKVEYASEPLNKVYSLISHYLSCFRPYFLHYDIAAKIINLERKLDIVAEKKSRLNFSSIIKSSEALEGQMIISFIDKDEKNKIISIIGTNNMTSVSTCSEEQCWLLFSQLAFLGKTDKEKENLKTIGKKIVQKCKSIPLAIKFLGSLLLFKRDIKEWNYILDSKIWELEYAFLPLLLSYYDLPPVLKRCLSYCAMFPKDYNIQKDYLIKLWMAEDYIRVEENKDAELVGEEYFEILAMRSFFQDFQKNEIDNSIKSFKLHGIVHDYARLLTQNEYFTMEVVYIEHLEISHKQTKHLMVILRSEALFPHSIYDEIWLRCLVVKCDGIAIEIDLLKLFDKLIYLRTLDLSDCSLQKLPKEIKNLIHLRHLNLSTNDIKELPETLCKLCNLQTLDITSCKYLKKLPQGMGKLINLRHLLNSQTPLLSYMPKSVERLTNLRTLSQFVVSDVGYGTKSCSLECLKNLNHLRKIGINGLKNVKHVGEVEDAKFNNKQSLHTLSLSFVGKINRVHEVVLEAFQPPPNLMELWIAGYNGLSMLPTWIESLTNLRRLSLRNFENFYYMPPFGKLSSLESLTIINLNVRSVGNEFLGGQSEVTSSSSSVICFPKLKYLSFEFMMKWKEWNYDITNGGEKEDITIMPYLEILKISHCYNLNSLPNHLYKLTTLKLDIYKCPLLKRTSEN